MLDEYTWGDNMKRRKSDPRQLTLLQQEELEKIKWREYLPELQAYCAAFLKSHGLADHAGDAAQEALYRAVASYKQYQERGKFKAWLHRIARGAAVDIYGQHFKKCPRTGETEARTVSLEGMNELATPAMQDVILDAMILRNKVKTLSERTGYVFLARVDGGFTFGDIALTLRISRQAVWMHYQAAVQTLRAYMEEVNIPAKVDKRPRRPIYNVKE